MAAEDRIGAAYHEAGHAIVLWVFGLQVDSVAIGIAGDDGAGHTKVMGSDEHLSEFDRIVISEAGLEAQEVFEAPDPRPCGIGRLRQDHRHSRRYFRGRKPQNPNRSTRTGA